MTWLFILFLKVRLCNFSISRKLDNALYAFFAVRLGRISLRMTNAATVGCTESEAILLALIEINLPFREGNRRYRFEGLILHGSGSGVGNNALDTVHSRG